MSGQPQPPSVPPPQPQPFRFWLPYRSNVGTWRQQPRPIPAPSNRPQPPGPSPSAPAEPAPPPRARATEEDIPIQADSSDESDTIAVEALDSLRSRGARPAMADLELTLSRSPPSPEGHGQGTSGDGHAKISISGFPRERLFDGARAPYRREIEDGLKSLAGRETPSAPRPSDQGYRVITLAGHNVGASMVVGNGTSGASRPRTTAEQEVSSARPPSVAANVNNNVQGVNNSAMEQSTCNSGDPGVRLDIKNAHEKPAVLAPSEEPEEKPKERTLPAQEKSTAASARESAPVPPRTRRCLRALMIEERKPKPPACRFQCVADHAPPPATSSDSGSKSAEESTR